MEIWEGLECGKEGNVAISEGRVMGRKGLWPPLWEYGKKEQWEYGDKGKMDRKGNGKERECGGGEREVERKGMWVYGRKGM